MPVTPAVAVHGGAWNIPEHLVKLPRSAVVMRLQLLTGEQNYIHQKLEKQDTSRVAFSALSVGFQGRLA